MSFSLAKAIFGFHCTSKRYKSGQVLTYLECFNVLNKTIFNLSLFISGGSSVTYIANDIRILTPNFDSFLTQGGKLRFKGGNGVILAG
jgi:hypothetical protein